MERFFKKISKEDATSYSPINASNTVISSSPLSPPVKVPIIDDTHFDSKDLPSDPGLRPNISSYPPNMIEHVRRSYLLKGPCQPREHDFPQKLDGNRKRKFVASWFDEFKDCERGHDGFVSGGFNNWRKKERLRDHVGDHNSDHNKCRLACHDLMNQAQHIEVAISKVSKQSKVDYRCRLNASIVCLRYLITQGLAFRGHDESEGSLNQGNFIELLKVIASCNEEIGNVVLNNAPENLKLTSPKIQKDVISAATIETTNAIIEDLGNDFLSILVDECCDISVKEQMGVVIRYVNKSGYVIEHFLGLVHVSDTSATSLEKAICYLFSTYGLSISSLRGQGYDGASNMRGEFNGLKSLILKKSHNAYYVHCFVHQLQLTLVSVAKKHTTIGSFFNFITRLSNVVGGSCKRRYMLREKEKEKVIEGIANDEIMTGKGLNQEKSLKRPGDTRWSSHYSTLINLLNLFSIVIGVFEYIAENGNDDSQRDEAIDLLEIVNQFNFIFVLHLMMRILGITYDLSQALQRKDQDIVNAMSLVKVSKARLQKMRDDGWENLLVEVSKFCGKNEIVILNMEDIYATRGRPRRRTE